MKYYFSLIILLTVFFGCKKDKEDDAVANNYAYLGGEIINPKTNFVVLFKNQEVLDTVNLNGINRFIYKIDSLNKGIYTFKHGNESQVVLLEPKDSILFRLNTLDFDESLVFTGNGDKKNNYLVNGFLEHEREERHIIRLCQLTPTQYEKHIDSIKARNQTILKNFME